MLLNWNEHRDELLGKVNEFAKLTPEFMRGLVKMDAGASATSDSCRGQGEQRDRDAGRSLVRMEQSG